MDLELTDDQNELRAAVRDVLEHESPIAVARKVVETGEPATDLWRTMAGLDWFGLSVPEAAGGMGLGFTEVAVVAEELGRCVAPSPFLATMTQYVPAVVAAGSPQQIEELLAPVVAGESAGALALADHPRRWDLAGVCATARLEGGEWALEGTKRSVLASEGDRLVVAARVSGAPDTPDGLGLFVVDGDQVKTDPVNSVDRSRPLLDVRLDGVTVPAARVLGEPGSPAVTDALTRATEQAAVGLALEIVGACDVLLEMAVAYAIDRKQFGVPIGQFQAIKHKMADSYVAVQRARALAYFAVAAIEEDDPRRPVAVAMAKAAAGDCQRQVAQDAFQTFGGIGFTWEHDQHLYVKRVKTDAGLFGSAADHRRVVAAHLGVTG